jgi:signal transduction histidine kinase
MHSGINTYMPRGLSSLKKRILPDVAESMKIVAPMKMIEEGLAHTQKVYKNVYEFTNLVKSHSNLSKETIDLKQSLEKYLSGTSYSTKVSVSELGGIEANELLFCAAIDNLIKNGLKYNKSIAKEIKVYISGEYIVVEDNGTGLSSKMFEKIVKKGIDSESDTGIGLSIAKAIVEEHGFSMECEGSDKGTKIKIKTT